MEKSSRKGEGHRRKRDDRGRAQTRKVTLNWSMLFVISSLLALGGAIYIWTSHQKGAQASIPGRFSEDHDAVVRVRSKFSSPSEADALGLVMRALSASTDADVAKLFHPATASTQEILGFLREMADTDGVFDHCEWLSSMNANGLSIEGVLAYFKKDGKSHLRLVHLIPNESGVWKIDFDAFARVTQPSWSDLLENKAEHGLIRVILANDNYYNGPYADEQQWVCYGMTSPDLSEILLGYCRVGSVQERAIKAMSPDDSKVVRATLQIRHVDGAAPRQFEIAEVVAEDWVIRKTPFEEAFK